VLLFIDFVPLRFQIKYKKAQNLIEQSSMFLHKDK